MLNYFKSYDSFILEGQLRGTSNWKEEDFLAHNEIKWEAITKIQKIFDDLGKPFWLDYGTLLGLYRDGKIILNDSDIDVSCFATDIDIDLLNKLKDGGFLNGASYKEAVKQYTEDSYFTPTKIRTVYKPGGKVAKHKGFPLKYDLCTYYPYKDFHFYISSDDAFRVKTDLLKFKKMKINGVSFSIPKDTDKYLECLYGKGWKTPDDSFGPKYYTEKKPYHIWYKSSVKGLEKPVVYKWNNVKKEHKILD